MTLIEISVTSTIIDNLVNTDAEIQTALEVTGGMTNLYEVAVIPISNTKSRVFIVYNNVG